MDEYVSGYITSGSYFTYKGVRYGEHTQVLFTEEFYKKVGEYLKTGENIDATIVRNVEEADFVIAHKNFAKGGTKVLSIANDYRLPIYYVRSNSMSQVQKVVKEALHITDSETLQGYYDDAERKILNIVKNRKSSEFKTMPGVLNEVQQNLEKLASYIFSRGVKVLSVYAFSTENFKRSEEEVKYLMDIFVDMFKKECNKIHEEGIKIVFSGRRNRLRKDVVEAMNEITEKTEVMAKIRYSAKEAKAYIYPVDNGKMKVEFEEPQRAITPGQAVVFYDGDYVPGGGTIIGDKDYVVELLKKELFLRYFLL